MSVFLACILTFLRVLLEIHEMKTYGWILAAG